MLCMGQYGEVEMGWAEWPLNLSGSAAGVLCIIRACDGGEESRGVGCGQKQGEVLWTLSWNWKELNWKFENHLQERKLQFLYYSFSRHKTIHNSTVVRTWAPQGMGEEHSRGYQMRKSVGVPSFFQTNSKNPENILLLRYSAVSCYRQGPEVCSMWVGHWQVCVLMVYLQY